MVAITHRVRILPLLLLAGAAPAMAAAPEGGSLPVLHDSTFEDLAEVVVVSKKPEDVLNAPGSVLVFTDEDIARYGWRDLREILQAVPNMDMVWQYYWSNGGQRGFTGNSAGTLLLIDGREVQNLLADEAMLQNFPAHRIKRVEVLQGPGSALYGSNANEGVINIVTRTADAGQEDVSMARLLVGEASTRGVYALSRRNKEDASFGVSGSYFTSLQDWDRLKDFVADDGAFSRRPEVDSVRDKARGKIEFPVENATFDFHASGRHLYAGGHFFREENSEGIEMVRVRLGERKGYRSTLHAFAGARLERGPLEAFAEYVHTRERDDFVGAAQEIVPLPNRTFRPDRNRIKAQGTWRLPNQTVVFGYDGFIHEAGFYEDTNLVGGLMHPTEPAVRYETWRSAVFAEDAIHLLDGRLKANLGIRFEKQKGLDPRFTPRLGLVGRFWRGGSLKVLYGRGVRPPNAFELNNARSAGIPADDVPSRETESYEVNWMQEAWLGDFRLFNNLSAYRMVASRNFQQVFVQDTFRLALTADRDVYGVEDFLRLSFRGRYGGFLGGRWVDPSATTVAGEDIVADVPVLRGKLGTYGRPLPWLLASVFIDASGPVRTDANTPDGTGVEVLRIPGWVNTNINVRLGDFALDGAGGMKLALALFVENVFDEVYYHPNHRGVHPIQYLQPPRNMRLSGDLAF